MRIVALFAALALTGCGLNAGTVASAGAATADAIGAPPPVAVADATVLDERAILALELAYKAARIAVELSVDTKVVWGATAARVAEYDNKAFLALTVARSAYRTGNASSYKTALSEAQAAISQLLSLTGN